MATYWNIMTDNAEVWDSHPGRQLYYSTPIGANRYSSLKNFMLTKASQPKPTYAGKIQESNLNTAATLIPNNTYCIVDRSGGASYPDTIILYKGETTGYSNMSLPYSYIPPTPEEVEQVEQYLLGIMQGLIDEVWPPITNPCTKPVSISAGPPTSYIYGVQPTAHGSFLISKNGNNVTIQVTDGTMKLVDSANTLEEGYHEATKQYPVNTHVLSVLTSGGAIILHKNKAYVLKVSAANSFTIADLNVTLKNCDTPLDCQWRSPSGNIEIWCDSPGAGYTNLLNGASEPSVA